MKLSIRLQVCWPIVVFKEEEKLQSANSREPVQTGSSVNNLQSHFISRQFFSLLIISKNIIQYDKIATWPTIAESLTRKFISAMGTSFCACVVRKHEDMNAVLKV